MLQKCSNMLHNSPILLGLAPVLFFLALSLVVHAKTECEKLPILPHTNFLYFPKIVDFSLFPMLIVLQPHASNNYGCDFYTHPLTGIQ
jgi:hypothetical protein